MESWHCLLLLCTLSLVPASGEETRNYDDSDLVSFLRSFYPGVLVRDEPFITNRDFEMNSLKELGRPVVLSIKEQSKDKPVSLDTNGSRGPVVFTKDGQIKGTTLDKAHVFYGVPYADPPVGSYRWKPPRPVSPWPGVYDASFPRAACMQACRGPIAEECPRNVRNKLIYRCCDVSLEDVRDGCIGILVQTDMQ